MLKWSLFSICYDGRKLISNNRKWKAQVLFLQTHVLHCFLKWSEANTSVIVAACLLSLTWITARNTLYLCNRLYLYSCIDSAASVVTWAFHMSFLAYRPRVESEQEPQTVLGFAWVQLQLSQPVVTTYKVGCFTGSWSQKLKLLSKFLGEIQCKTPLWNNCMKLFFTVLYLQWTEVAE